MKQFLYTLSIIFLLYKCSSPINLKTSNSNFFTPSLIRTYYLPSEIKRGEVEELKFSLKEPRKVEGKINNFSLENCIWFLDFKKEESEVSNSKKINLQCNDRFYILDLNAKPDLISKISYDGIYKEIFSKLKKAIILEAVCNLPNKEETSSKKNNFIECYPYPHDISKYINEQKREVIVSSFLYVDKPEDLKTILKQNEEFRENDRIFEALTIEFASQQKRKDQSQSSLIGKDFEFQNCEFIDFQEFPALNSKGQELKKKIDELIHANLQIPENAEKLKSTIEEYINCGSLCSSKEKNVYAVFEVKNNLDNKTVLLFLKLSSQKELSNYKRFQTYKIVGILNHIDFSKQGLIEKIHLDMIPTKETKN